jgi:hypothetical protein
MGILPILDICSIPPYYQISQRTSPPTFAAFAFLPVMMPLFVERITVPKPPSTLGMFSTPAYARKPGLDTRRKPLITDFLSLYLSVIAILPL